MAGARSGLYSLSAEKLQRSGDMILRGSCAFCDGERLPGDQNLWDDGRSEMSPKSRDPMNLIPAFSIRRSPSFDGNSFVKILI
jgi:hypothetical protein